MSSAAMRSALALVASLAFLPTANAANVSSDKQFNANAEFRTRYTFENNESGTGQLAPNNGNNVESRLKMTGNYKVSEKFGVTATLLDNFNWGSSDLLVNNSNGTASAYSSGDGPAMHYGSSSNNLLLVQEAYGYWMWGDDIMIRFGRGSLQLADGAVIGVNDYDPIPNSFDGVLGTYEFDFGRISAWAVKFAVYDNGAAAKLAGQSSPTTGLSLNNSSDPEADGYGIAFDLKHMPDFLKMVNIHFIQNSKATTPGAATAPWLMADPLTTMGQNTIRYGLAVGGAASLVDYKLDGEGMTGTYYCAGNSSTAYSLGCRGSSSATSGYDTPTINNFNVSAYMAQLEAGFNFPEFMKARIFVKGHLDSGDSQSASSITKVTTYDPYYYNRAEGSGMMEVVGWGNLTYYNAGLTVDPTDQTKVGLQYFYFQKTNAQGRMNPGRYGEMVEFTSPNSAALGQEVDLWAEHKYDGGFSILAHVGAFVPGTSIKNGMAEDSVAQFYTAPQPQGAGVFPSGISRNQTFTQVAVQGKMSF